MKVAAGEKQSDMTKSRSDVFVPMTNAGGCR